MFSLSVYNRLPQGEEYSASLAGSVHFRYSRDGVHYSPLNQNYGMLFPTAEITAEDTIAPRCALEPVLYVRSALYGIAATFTDLAGNNQAVGQVYLWTTEDFIYFREVGLVPETELESWEKAPDNAVELSEELGGAILDAWLPLTARAVFLPAGRTLQKTEELWNVRAVVEYSDGSLDEKRVDWEVPVGELTEDGLHFTAGKHQIRGLIHKDDFPYPLAVGYADPVLFAWENRWYFLSTNDNLGNVGMFVRGAETEEELFGERAVERCILPYNPEKGWIQTFWAPEFHVIGGELYILFALGGRKWAPQCHMMKLKKGGDILNPDSWEEPIRVQRMDGTPLTTEGISLDMTHFRVGDTDYLAWSYRYRIGTPLDTGSMIYLATTDPERPWRLTCEPVLLTRPLYGWEYTLGTINNEGPYALLTEDKVYLAYSGGSANGYSYVVGYLIADKEADLLDPASWVKMPCPALSSYSVGIDGPGHNSFYVSAEGKTMIAYHGQLHTRCSAIHRVHFNKKGFPLLNMAPERDVPEGMREVEILFEAGETTE